MSQSKFLNSILTEGTILTIFGLFILILPKISNITFGTILSFTFISYGGYRAINGYLTRNFSGFMILNLISGSILLILGIMLLMIRIFNIDLILAILAIFFISSCLTTLAFSHRTRNILVFHKSLYVPAFLQLIFGFITILIIPSYAFWISGFLIGLDFLVSGIVYINLYFISKT